MNPEQRYSLLCLRNAEKRLEEATVVYNLTANPLIVSVYYPEYLLQNVERDKNILSLQNFRIKFLLNITPLNTQDLKTMQKDPFW
ncbi:hypothetical protein T10_6080 [Trichinella papuae]|uniref:Uncharacterized protein n=1 Tax=Trichinella papuae TaxID=268474 RepID=A0A0V1M4L4_9BILA|nr:hypothetical protein T10_6080 [Trichinella papuae]